MGNWTSVSIAAQPQPVRAGELVDVVVHVTTRYPNHFGQLHITLETVEWEPRLVIHAEALLHLMNDEGQHGIEAHPTVVRTHRFHKSTHSFAAGDNLVHVSFSIPLDATPSTVTAPGIAINRGRTYRLKAELDPVTWFWPRICCEVPVTVVGQ